MGKPYESPALADDHRKKTPQIIQPIERIMEDDTGGDPVRGCKWTHKTMAKVAER